MNTRTRWYSIGAADRSLRRGVAELMKCSGAGSEPDSAVDPEVDVTIVLGGDFNGRPLYRVSRIDRRRPNSVLWAKRRREPCDNYSMIIGARMHWCWTSPGSAMSPTTS